MSFTASDALLALRTYMLRHGIGTLELYRVERYLIDKVQEESQQVKATLAPSNIVPFIRSK